MEGIDFGFLSRFCLKAEEEGKKEEEISILRSASASSSHLKNKEFLLIL